VTPTLPCKILLQAHRTCRTEQLVTRGAIMNGDGYDLLFGSGNIVFDCSCLEAIEHNHRNITAAATPG